MIALTLTSFPIVTILPAEAASASGQENAFLPDMNWPRPLPNNWIMGDVSGVAVDRHNHIWVVQRPATLSRFDTQGGATPPTAKCCTAAPPVLEFDTDGTLLRSWGGPQQVQDWFDSEHGLFVDAEDHVWIVGSGAHDGQLLKFTAAGTLLLRIGKKGEFAAADDPSMLGRPTDVYVDVDRREAYVSDGYRNHRVIVFDADTGAFKRQWTAYGNKVDPAYQTTPDESRANVVDTSRFTTVHCLTMIGGDLYVCDRTNSRIQIFRPDGTYLREIVYNRELGGTSGSTWDAIGIPNQPDRLLVLDGSNSEIAVLDRQTGAVLGSLLSKGNAAGQMHWPHQLAVDQQARVYVGQVDKAGRVQRFLPNESQGLTLKPKPGTATYISAEEIEHVNRTAPGTDRNVRVIDIGHENFAVGIIHRGKSGEAGARPPRARPAGAVELCGRNVSELPEGGLRGGIVHDVQTEGYYIVSGGGRMFTGGHLLNGRHLPQAELNGPTCIGTAYDVTTRTVKKGDIVIVPAGVVHGWVDVPDHVDYLSFRPSPGILEAGWVNPVIEEE